jgi:hypothetical protein
MLNPCCLSVLSTEREGHRRCREGTCTNSSPRRRPRTSIFTQHQHLSSPRFRPHLPLIPTRIITRHKTHTTSAPFPSQVALPLRTLCIALPMPRLHAHTPTSPTSRTTRTRSQNDTKSPHFRYRTPSSSSSASYTFINHADAAVPSQDNLGSTSTALRSPSPPATPTKPAFPFYNPPAPTRSPFHNAAVPEPAPLTPVKSPPPPRTPSKLPTLSLPPTHSPTPLLDPHSTLLRSHHKVTVRPPPASSARNLYTTLSRRFRLSLRLRVLVLVV